MIGFFIKKAFFDGWDNLLGIIVQNLIYIVLLLCAIGSFMVSSYSVYLSIALLAVVIFVFSIALGGTAAVVKNYSNYERETWSAFAQGIKNNFAHSMLFFGIILFLVLLATFILPFYLAMNNMMTIILAVVLMWLFVIILLALPYYFPLMNLLPGDKPLKTFKKCFIIVSDNFLFTLFYLLYNTVVVAFSVLVMGIMPGVAGYMLGAEDAIKLLMFKYDYLEEHPDTDRHRIPWDELLYDEKEKVGPRSLKSMIFPWK